MDPFLLCPKMRTIGQKVYCYFCCCQRSQFLQNEQQADIGLSFVNCRQGKHHWHISHILRQHSVGWWREKRRGEMAIFWYHYATSGYVTGNDVTAPQDAIGDAWNSRASCESYNFPQPGDVTSGYVDRTDVTVMEYWCSAPTSLIMNPSLVTP